MRKSQWLVIVALIAYTVSFSGCDQGKTMMDQILPEPQPTEMMEPEPQLVVIDDPVLVQTFTDDRPVGDMKAESVYGAHPFSQNAMRLSHYLYQFQKFTLLYG